MVLTGNGKEGILSAILAHWSREKHRNGLDHSWGILRLSYLEICLFLYSKMEFKEGWNRG